jgi:hypothetical protein
MRVQAPFWHFKPSQQLESSAQTTSNGKQLKNAVFLATKVESVSALASLTVVTSSTMLDPLVPEYEASAEANNKAINVRVLCIIVFVVPIKKDRL